MKKIISNYSFNAAEKKITFSNVLPVRLENILLITNVTLNQIIYNFADPAFGGTVAANVLTLTFNTTAMTNDDKIQIFYDDGLVAAADNSVNAMTDVALTLKRIAKNMESLQVVDSAQRQRVAVETIANMNSISRIDNLVQFGSVDPKYMIIDLARGAYNTGIRANLTF